MTAADLRAEPEVRAVPSGGRPAGALPRITGVGTSVPPDSYTQLELLELYRIEDPRIRGVFANSAIERRHLSLPPRGPDGVPLPESQGELLAKHVRTGTAMGAAAVRLALADAGAVPADVRYLCCVSSTGFISPGLSALLIKELGLSPACARLDVVGMGCNAGLNALAAVGGWAGTHPGQLAVLLCVEACSAAYVFDGTMRTSVVNSLFGDGAAAITVRAGEEPAGVAGIGPGPAIVGSASHIITDAVGAMRYDWDDAQGRFSFYLDPEVPYVVGANAARPVDRLLAAAGLRRSQVAYWIVHSGGKKVIDAIRVNLGLSRYDLRHTIGVLREYGNLSSGSFLFSYQRLLAEGAGRPGEYGVLMTMGPGSTIETALLAW